MERNDRHAQVPFWIVNHMPRVNIPANDGAFNVGVNLHVILRTIALFVACSAESRADLPFKASYC